MEDKSDGGDAVYKDSGRPAKERAQDLVSRLSLEEKISQMLYCSSALPRLGIPEYNWWNECLHGVARAGVATVFPQAIAMAASFSEDLVFEVAAAISDEARAKHHEFARHEDRDIYKGLTFWSPNVNIFRDPRWGRGQETYGEDPYLTGRMGVAFVRGLQGDDPERLKVVATPKHFAVHSGPEPLRHEFDARVSEKDLWETYLPAFEECVKEGRAYSIMGAYNRTNGEPCCASRLLLEDILRGQWGFGGYVVSDCRAIKDIHEHHGVTASPEESAALAVNRGCDLNCGKEYVHLQKAVDEGLIAEETIDRAVTRLFEARFRLGMFDPPDQVPCAGLPYETVNCRRHRDLAARMARESMVLLKNSGSALPLSDNPGTIAVIGPNAESRGVLLGNYFGTPAQYVTALDGIRRRVSPETRVVYARGCALADAGANARHGFTEALSAAERADVVVACMGLSPELEGEEGAVANSDGGGDKMTLDLPGVQNELLEALLSTGTKLILVLFSGSAISVCEAHEKVPAILQAWYPGERGGEALADILFGHCSPSGRLPVTFVRSLDQLPDFTDYRMKNRTYRYMAGEPLYPFGYGLSYTSFGYSEFNLETDLLEAGQLLSLSVQVENTGGRDGDEVVQLYIEDLEASVEVPIRKLCGFKRISLRPGARKKVEFVLTPRSMAVVDERGRYVLEPGRFRLTVGGRQPDARSRELAGGELLCSEFEVGGEPLVVGGNRV